MGEEIFQVDAFTDTPFRGNPAAICMVNESREEAWMMNVAREMNLSETAFLHPEDDGYRLRWFTPAVEVELCGHATLASAHILWETGRLQLSEAARFYTRSGLLTARKSSGWIELDFPAEPEEEVDAPHPEIPGGLGITPKYIGRNRCDYLVEVDSEGLLREIRPDFAMLSAAPVRGVIVTSVSASEEYDFVSRFFAPAIGIREDPVTGSAHCCRGPFWSRRLGRHQFMAYQASSRGGILRVSLKDDRVFLAGKAVTVLRGRLL